MRVLIVVIMAVLSAAAVIEVKNNLGFPIPNAEICFNGKCVYTNSTGVAEVPPGVPVEIYINGTLVWQTVSSGHDVAVIYTVRTLDIFPLTADGVLVLKMVKTRAGYSDVEIPFRNNTLEKPLPVGKVRYPAVIVIDSIGGVHLTNRTHVETTVWDLSVDLEKLGLVRRCTFQASDPVRSLTVYQGNRLAGQGSNFTIYLIKGLEYRGFAYTDVLMPNGSSYIVEFRSCEKPSINYSVVHIQVFDSFGSLRRDWSIRIAGREYRGEAEVKVLPEVTYIAEINAGHTKRNLTIVPRSPSVTLDVVIPTARLVINYQAPVKAVYINGTPVGDVMPRSLELPPGNYSVVVGFGQYNETHRVELKPGAEYTLTITPRRTSGPGDMLTSLFVAVMAIIILVAVVVLAAGRRRKQSYPSTPYIS